MTVLVRLDEVRVAPPAGRVVAIGVFDGVHLGHQGIVAEAVTVAVASGGRSTVVTFFPHPETILRPGGGPRSLTLPGRKAELLSAMGIEEVVTVEFDAAFAGLSPEAFCSAVLSTRLGGRVVLVGENFRFGRNGAGTTADLAAFGRAHGFSVKPVPLVEDSGGPVSSTRIRNLLSVGEVGEAARLLGRPHRLEGVVTHGLGRGRTLQAPTANLKVSDGLALPLPGVYVTRTIVEGGCGYPSVTSVGTNPTFESDGVTRVETLLIEYEGDLYGRDLKVDFLEMIRPQKLFPDSRTLAEQIRQDVLAASERHRAFGDWKGSC